LKALRRNNFHISAISPLLAVWVNEYDIGRKADHDRPQPVIGLGEFFRTHLEALSFHRLTRHRFDARHVIYQVADGINCQDDPKNAIDEIRGRIKSGRSPIRPPLHNELLHCFELIGLQGGRTPAGLHFGQTFLLDAVNYAFIPVE
jgi:hypothetical protein